MRNLTNEIAPADQHISLRLIGTTCNRDAIGARAELVLQTTGPRGQRKSKLVRTVRAGDAFLSQSSTKLHFGIKKDASVEQLIVDWPGGKRERFRGISAGASYRIKQGSGQAIGLEPRKPISLAAKPYQPIPPTAAARIVLPGRVALPPIDSRFKVGADSVEVELGDAPTLVTFWTSSCANCRRELTDIAEHRSEFEQAKLNVVAICLDGLDQPVSRTLAGQSDAKEFLQAIDFPFQAAHTTRKTIELIQQFQNGLFSKYPDFVVPLSFLVDADRQVVSIYRGAFSHETLLRDRGLVNLEDATLRTLATPLVGTWITKPATRSQLAEFVGGRLMANQPEVALQYYEAAIKTEQDVNRQSAREQAAKLRLLIDRKEGL